MVDVDAAASEAVPEAPTTNVVKEARRVSKRSRRLLCSLFADPDPNPAPDPGSPCDDPTDNPSGVPDSLMTPSSSFVFPMSNGLTRGATGGRNQRVEGEDGEATSFRVCSSDCRTTFRGAPRWVHMLTRSLVVARISAATCIETVPPPPPPPADGAVGDDDDDDDDDEEEDGLTSVSPADSSPVPLAVDAPLTATALALVFTSVDETCAAAVAVAVAFM